MTPAPLFPAWEQKTPVVGVIHLQPLPAAPGYGGDFRRVLTAALRDAEALVEGGVDGLLVENFGDTPFFPDEVPAHTIAHMTAVAVDVRRRFPLALGINVLRNDGVGALAVAAASGAEFIRVNVLCGARVADQGLLTGNAHRVLRERAAIGADIRILADVNVKHAAPLAPVDLAREARDTVERGKADALIVSGSATGESVNLEDLSRVAEATRVPVFVGSGARPETVGSLAETAHGFIVGTAFKEEGDVHRPVDPARVRRFMERLRAGKDRHAR